MNVKTQLYNMARPIKTNNTKYESIASQDMLPNYRVISSGEVNIRGRELNLPTYVRDFVNQHGEVVLICNIINTEVSGIIFRALEEKAFINYGMGKGNVYGIGQLEPDFKYGDLLVLLEGAIDRDICSLYITKNSLALLTNGVSNSQLQVIENLTNKVLLLLDNDDAAEQGEKSTVNKLRSKGITCYTITKSNLVKDLGDLYDLKRKGDSRADQVILNYRAQVQIHGGKIV